MINKRTIFFMIFTISTINAMETKKICDLAYLPAEIHNHIASYLTFPNSESDDEFIARTRASGKISKEHKALVEQQERANYEWGKGSLGIIRAYSVNCSKIISLEKIMKNPKVTIFDIQNKTMQESVHLT